MVYVWYSWYLYHLVVAFDADAHDRIVFRIPKHFGRQGEPTTSHLLLQTIPWSPCIAWKTEASLIKLQIQEVVVVVVVAYSMIQELGLDGFKVP